MGRALKPRNVPVANDEQYLQQAFAPQQNDRILFLSGDIAEHSTANIITQLISLANQNQVLPIHLMISTYGGSIEEMFSIIDTMKFLPCPVYTVGVGKTMSAGTPILAAGIKGKRKIGKNARVMIHPVSGCVNGNIFDMMNELEETKRLHNLMVSCLVQETKMTKDQIEGIMHTGRDYYITAKDAIKFGIVDSIIGE